MQQMRALMFLVGLSFVKSEVHFGDPCYLSPFPKDFKDEQLDLEVPENCTVGSVAWNYPVGTLYMHLKRKGGPYSLCLEDSWSTNLGGLRTLSGGELKEVPLPTKDTPACTQSVDGKTEFYVKATSNLLYMTIFDYKVEPIWVV